ncbi:MAG: NYN domain-containing protein, partial [Candidatus Shapirobacteria bacterium]
NRAKPTALSLATAGRLSSKRSKKAIVFIDGSNWYHKLRLLLNANVPSKKGAIKPPIHFDLRGFVEQLVSPDVLLEIRYYIGKVRRIQGDEKSEQLYTNQQRLIGFLQTQSVTIGFGHLIPYPDGIFHEKGVDVLLAVEMIRFAREGNYDRAYLISSDTDLVPAAEECRRLKKEVVYVGSSVHGQSFGLTKACQRTILLQPKDVASFVPPKPI